METYIVSEVEKGAKLPGLYPMNEETKARYEAWKKKPLARARRREFPCFYASKIFGFFAIPSNFIILLGLFGALLLRTRFSRCGLAARDREPGAAGGDRAFAGRQCADRAAGAALPALGPQPRRAARHRRARRRAQSRRLARPQHRCAQRSGRTPHRGGRARAPLSRRAHHLFRRLGRGHFRRAAGGRVRAAAAGEPRHCAGPRRRRGQVAQHRRERAVLAASWRSRSRASAGCWSPRPITCRAPSASSARPAFRSKPIRSIGAPAAPATRCGRSRPWARACGGPTPPCASGSGSRPTG